MSHIEKIELPDYVIYVSKFNSNTVSLRYDEIKNVNYLYDILEKNEMFTQILTPSAIDKNHLKLITMSIHVSSDCNMRCKYCFKKERNECNLTIEEAKIFMDKVIASYPTAGRYVVDMSGSGEPLLNKKLVFELAEYSRYKSDEIKREVLPMLATK